MTPVPGGGELLMTAEVFAVGSHGMQPLERMGGREPLINLGGILMFRDDGKQSQYGP